MTLLIETGIIIVPRSPRANPPISPRENRVEICHNRLEFEDSPSNLSHSTTNQEIRQIHHTLYKKANQ